MTHSNLPRAQRTFFGLLFILGITLLPGCASVYSVLVAPEIEGPQIADEKVVDFMARNAPGREVTLFSDASNRPPIYSQDFAASETSSMSLLSGISYSVRGVSVSGGLLTGPNLIDGAWLGGKLQFLGSRGLLADSPFYLTGWSRIGGQSSSKDGNKNGDFGPGGYPWKSERRGSFFNAGITVGYAVTPTLIPFIGYGKGTATGHASVSQSISSDGASPAAGYSNAFDAATESWGGGIQFCGESTRFTVITQNARFTVGTDAVVTHTVGLALEFKIHSPESNAAIDRSEN